MASLRSLKRCLGASKSKATGGDGEIYVATAARAPRRREGLLSAPQSIVAALSAETIFQEQGRVLKRMTSYLLVGVFVEPSLDGQCTSNQHSRFKLFASKGDIPYFSRVKAPPYIYLYRRRASSPMRKDPLFSEFLSSVSSETDVNLLYLATGIGFREGADLDTSELATSSSQDSVAR